MNYYPLCTVSLITPLSREMWHLYCLTDGLNHETFESMMNMPYTVVEGYHIIQCEVNRIDKVKQNEDNAIMQANLNQGRNRRF